MLTIDKGGVVSARYPVSSVQLNGHNPGILDPPLITHYGDQLGYCIVQVGLGAIRNELVSYFHLLNFHPFECVYNWYGNGKVDEMMMKGGGS